MRSEDLKPEWQQCRLLRDLNDIDTSGGRLTGRRVYEHEGRVAGRHVYEFDGWKGTRGDGGIDISYKMGADLVDPLLERGCIRVDAAGEGEFKGEFEITDAGFKLFREKCS
jgi:hypothetical protein